VKPDDVKLPEGSILRPKDESAIAGGVVWFIIACMLIFAVGLPFAVAAFFERFGSALLR
jgi:hypothetical protein